MYRWIYIYIFTYVYVHSSYIYIYMYNTIILYYISNPRITSFGSHLALRPAPWMPWRPANWFVWRRAWRGEKWRQNGDLSSWNVGLSLWQWNYINYQEWGCKMIQAAWIEDSATESVRLQPPKTVNLRKSLGRYRNSHCQDVDDKLEWGMGHEAARK